MYKTSNRMKKCQSVVCVRTCAGGLCSGLFSNWRDCSCFIFLKQTGMVEILLQEKSNFTSGSSARSVFQTHKHRSNLTLVNSGRLPVTFVRLLKTLLKKKKRKWELELPLKEATHQGEPQECESSFKSNKVKPVTFASVLFLVTTETVCVFVASTHASTSTLRVHKRKMVKQ